MSFWNLTNPAKPWGLFDIDAQLDISFDWSAWLTDAGATYVSHTIETDAALDEVSSEQAAGVVTVLLKAASPVTAEIGSKYAVTCHITASAGSSTLKDDRTVWLKVAER